MLKYRKDVCAYCGQEIEDDESFVDFPTTGVQLHEDCFSDWGHKFAQLKRYDTPEGDCREFE